MRPLVLLLLALLALAPAGARADDTGPPLSVQEVVLFKSVLGAHGAAHTPLWSAKFWT